MQTFRVEFCVYDIRYTHRLDVSHSLKSYDKKKLRTVPRHENNEPKHKKQSQKRRSMYNDAPHNDSAIFCFCKTKFGFKTVEKKKTFRNAPEISSSQQDTIFVFQYFFFRKKYQFLLFFSHKLIFFFYIFY